MTTQVWNFADASNWTFDTNRVEITGGRMRLKAGWPTNLLLYSTFNANLNATYSVGLGTASTQGNPAVDPTTPYFGAASCKMNAAWPPTGVYYSQAGTYPMASGTMEGFVRASYNGVAGQHHAIFSCGRGVADARNAITLYHRNDGNIYGRYWDQNGVFAGSFNFGAWNWVANQWYHFSYNFTNGTQRLFIDGVQHGPTGNQAGVRDNNGGVVCAGIGYDLGDGIQTTMWHDDFTVYGAVQRTGNFTPPAHEIDGTVSQCQCACANAIYPITFEAFRETLAVSNGTVSYALRMRGYDYFFPAGANDWSWRLSTMVCPGFTCSAADMATFIRYRKPNSGGMSLVVVMQPDGGGVTPEIDQLELDYNP